MQVRNGLFLLLFLRLSCRSDFTSESDARPQSGIFISPMLVESGGEIGLALRIRYVPAMGIVSR